MSVINIAAYKFVPLAQLKELRQKLQRLSRRLALRGTILLAEEGVNLFVAGDRSGIDALLAELQSSECVGTLDVKESATDYQPFRRMLVKIKREIIPFGAVGIDPARKPSRKLPPAELRQWLDQGKELVLLDTRNDYEVKLGTFVGAHSCGIDHFRDFPAAASSLPEAWRSKPLVMFCTGGIRCEKAGPWLEQIGFNQVYQLDGGILNYFYQVGQEHYQGDCFVFDQRVAVDSALRETDAAQCYACQAILTREEQQSEHYVPGQSCPCCYRGPEQQLADLLAERRRKIDSIAWPLPGCIPYDNRRPIYVPARCDKWNVVDFLAATAAGMERMEWESEIERGRVRIDEQPVRRDRFVRPGECYEHWIPSMVEPEVNANIDILYEDAALVVVNKPAPLPMHPGGRFNKNTLAFLLGPVYAPERLRNAHRLDANTTGVVVFTRSHRMAQRLQAQFSAGEVKKTYLARVEGCPQEVDFSCNDAIAAHAGPAGVRQLDANGLAAETRFCVIRPLPDATTLVQAMPLTGRTNQIRLHLWSLGLPIAGDPTYRRDGTVLARQTLSPNDPPMCLHAWKARFKHPATGVEVEFVAPPPTWAEVLATR